MKKTRVLIVPLSGLKVVLVSLRVISLKISTARGSFAVPFRVLGRKTYGTRLCFVLELSHLVGENIPAKEDLATSLAIFSKFPTSFAVLFYGNSSS